MAEYNFNFCPNTRVAEVIAPQEAEIQDFNGWDYTPTPVLPYRRRFKITLSGLRWYLSDFGGLDFFTDQEHNAGLLEQFYADHRKHKPFNFVHEYLGLLEMRFDSPVSVPKAIPNSGGLIDSLEIQTIHHSPSY